MGNRNQVWQSFYMISDAMNGGDGAQSYVQNSSYQRGALDVAKPIIEEEIAKNLDIKRLDSPSICIADFGCSTGHNSFPAMQIIIDAINKSSPHSQTREFLVLFNDVASNDFNTLFRSLPAHCRAAAGVPGDFRRRLLPPSSLHFAYSSWSLHWLTEVPKAVASRDSPAWNKGRILYSQGRKEVCDAYLEQLEKDVGAFLEARAVEIVGGGGMALVIPGVPASWDPETEYTIPCHINLLGSCLMDMARQGRVGEAEIDSFNFPYYFPTLHQLKAMVHKTQSFSIQRAEIIHNPGNHTLSSVEEWAAFYRAVHEGLLARHFGRGIIDELFHMFANKLAVSPDFHNPCNDRSLVILLVLKRNKY